MIFQSSHYDPSLFSELHDNTVHLWLVDEEEVTRAADLTHYPSLLSEDENSKWLSLRSQRKKQQFLIARATLRTLLSRYIKTLKPEDLNIVISPSGKPMLEMEIRNGIQFNISHSQGKTLIGVTRNKLIGVDIEYMNPHRKWREIANDYFHEKEWPHSPGVCENTDGLDLMSKFYKIWTLKEAFVKAEGSGMAIPFDGFYFDCHGSHSPILTIDQASNCDSTTSWEVSHQFLDEAYSMAVSVEGALTGLTEAIIVNGFVPLATTKGI